MAVITPLSEKEIRDFLAQYSVALPTRVVPSRNGIENTTYFVTTAPPAGNQGNHQEWVLTLIEHAGVDQVDFTCRLLEHLARVGLPVPAPVSGLDGRSWHMLAGKPAWLVPRAAGQHPIPITAEHCAAVGDFLGAMHRADETFAHKHTNSRGLAWLLRSAATVELPEDERRLLAGQIDIWERLQGAPLPMGSIHGDLFHDNTLFDGERLVAVIDFLFCCTDWLLLDVAIAVNDWCDAGAGDLDESRCHALLAAYAARRPFTLAERNHWQEMLALAATRFWLSRLQPADPPPGPGPPVHKDPREYLLILRQRLRGVSPLPLAL